MKTLMKLVTVLAIIIGSTTSSLAQPDNGHTRTLTDKCKIGPNKSFHNFSLFGSDPMLSINHVDGTLTVVEWDKSEVEYIAEIETRANTKKNAEILNNAIEVKMTADKDGIVTIKTTIDNKAKLEDTGGQGISRNVSLTIKVPRNISIYLKGKGVLGTIEAPINSIFAQTEYFSLKATKINNNATINSKMGEIEIEQIDGVLAINGQHTKVTVNRANDAVGITTNYRDITIGQAKDASINLTYGSLSINNINDLKITQLSYGDCTIDTLRNALIVDSMKYGKLKAHFTESTEYVKIDATYTDVDMTIKDDDYQALTFDLSGAATPIKMQLLDGSCGESDTGVWPIRGTWGKAGTDGNKGLIITVRNRYGSINFNSTK